MVDEAVVKILLDAMRTQTMVVLALGSVIVILMGAILAFMVGWNLRSDGKVGQLAEKLAETAAREKFLEEMCKENFPELFNKYDTLLGRKLGHTPKDGVRVEGKPS